jgi:hypothetical protein
LVEASFDKHILIQYLPYHLSTTIPGGVAISNNAIRLLFVGAKSVAILSGGRNVAKAVVKPAEIINVYGAGFSTHR